MRITSIGLLGSGIQNIVEITHRALWNTCDTRNS